MSWADGPLAAFDVESTGIDTETDRIVTACVARIRPDRPTEISSWLIAVDIDIDPAATEVHKITTEHARAHGKPAVEAVAELVETIRECWTEGMPICGFNCRFDFSILDSESRRWLGKPLEVTGPVIDSLIIDKAVDKFRKGKRTLDVTRQHYGVRLDSAHDATEDALAAARVAWKLARLYPQVGNATPEELHTLTAGWFAEQQTSFADYLSGKIAKGIKDDTERAEVLARAELIRADAKGWPVRGAA